MTYTISSTCARMASFTQYFFWRHPEWWSIALCGLAWTLLLLQSWQHVSHRALHRITFSEELVCWVLMVAAMMLPLVLYSVWITAIGSLWARRHRAIAGFLGGYFAPWLFLGIMIAALRQESWTHNYSVAALGFVAAALWQRTRMHRRGLVACHRTLPLAPAGWRADCDCLRYGCTIGIACLVSCWPLMLACAFAGHGLVAMAGGTAMTALERWSFRPRRPAVLVGTLTLASYYLVLAVWGRGFAVMPH